MRVRLEVEGRRNEEGTICNKEEEDNLNYEMEQIAPASGGAAAIASGGGTRTPSPLERPAITGHCEVRGATYNRRNTSALEFRARLPHFREFATFLKMKLDSR